MVVAEVGEHCRGERGAVDAMELEAVEETSITTACATVVGDRAEPLCRRVPPCGVHAAERADDVGDGAPGAGSRDHRRGRRLLLVPVTPMTWRPSLGVA